MNYSIEEIYMKILKIFEEKLRYKNYSEKSIKLYVSYLSSFLFFDLL